MYQINLLAILDKFRVIWRWLNPAVILLLVFLLFRDCRNSRVLASKYRATKDSVYTYKLSNGQLVSSNNVLLLAKDQLQDQVIFKDAQFKELMAKFSKVSSLQNIRLITKIPTINLPLSSPVTKKDLDSTTGNLKFERLGSKFDKWYEFGYKVTQDSITIEPFSTWTEVKRVDGFKRKWFLGRQTLTSDVTLTNPYIEVSELKTVFIPIPRPFYETRLFNIAVGAAIMYGIKR